MRPKGSSKRTISQVSDENNNVALSKASAFGACATSSSNSLGPIPLNQQMHVLGTNSTQPPNGPSAKPKLLFGDSTAANTNQVNIAPVMATLDLSKVTALKATDMPPSFEQDPTWVGTPRPDESNVSGESTDDIGNLAAAGLEKHIAETDCREE